MSGQSEINRDKIIIRTSVIGILTNVFLSCFKAVIGIMSNSIAVILDAVNNLSDALSSVITIIGTKLAGKLPNKKHPFGYGRIEYLSAMIVAGIVLYAGITSLIESIKKIITPETPDYNTISLIIIAVAVIVKIVLGKYVKNQGKKANSGSLIASGSDALFDAILSASVLISAIIFILTDISLEAYVGVAISGFIIKSGIEMMIETLNEILGTRADKKLTDKIKKIIKSEPVIRGVYDLIMYNYGPDKYYASVHIELPEETTAKEIDKLTRKLGTKVYQESGVILAAVGLYSYNTNDEKTLKIQKKINEIVLKHKWAVQIHGFYIDTKTKEISFDVVLNFDINPEKALEIIHNEIQNEYPNYIIQISPDVDISTTD